MRRELTGANLPTDDASRILSLDTNLLLYAQNRDCPEHESARRFVEDCAARDDIAICDLVLLELYQLLRNPAVLSTPLNAPDAAAVCATWRDNPRWALIENAPVMDKVWALPGARTSLDVPYSMPVSH